jgi:hypothetical protein
MKGGKVIDGKGGAEHLMSNTERLSRFSEEELKALERGIGVHSGSAGRIGSSDVLRQAYAYGHTAPEEQARALDPDKVHRVPGADGNDIQLHGRNVFYGVRDDAGTQVAEYSIGGPKTVDGSFDGGVGAMEEQAAFMLVEVNARIQKILRDDPEADIDVDIRGHSRGGVSAAELERDVKGLYHDNAHLHFRNLQLDPVPGGVIAVNPGYEQHFDPGQGAVHPHLVKALREAPDFTAGSPRDGVEVDGQVVPIEPGKPRPGDRHAVVYSVRPEGVDKALFTPQEVMGADVMIITPESHDLYQKRAQVRDGQFGIGGYEAEIDGQWQHIGGADIASKLPKGIYVAVPSEQGMMLIPAPPLNPGEHSRAQLEQAADDIIAAAGGTPFSMNVGSGRQAVLRESIMNALDPNHTESVYGERVRDESSNLVNGSQSISHRQRPRIQISKVEAKEQARWAKDIVEHQRAEMDAQKPGLSQTPEQIAHFQQLEEGLKQPENHAVARDLHLQYRDQDRVNAAIAEGGVPDGLSAQSLAPSATTPSQNPGFWEGVKQRFSNLWNHGSFSTDQQLAERTAAETTIAEDRSPLAAEPDANTAFGVTFAPDDAYHDDYDAQELPDGAVQFDGVPDSDFDPVEVAPKI